VSPDETKKNEFKAALLKLKCTFEARMKSEDISFEFRYDECADLDLSPGIIAQGKTCDLIIVQMHTQDGEVTAKDIEEIADLVLVAGRPVLAIPPKLPRAFSCERITIAWDGSREAARAAFDSIPILQKAKDVEIVRINPGEATGNDLDALGIEIGNVLARHDVNITANPIISSAKISASISSQVNTNASDILVMGAYGHLRLKVRMLLGGVTERILRKPPCVILLSN
jgi:nucleotide-binding universal stress UspA family protein